MGNGFQCEKKASMTILRNVKKGDFKCSVTFKFRVEGPCYFQRNFTEFRRHY